MNLHEAQIERYTKLANAQQIQDAIANSSFTEEELKEIRDITQERIHIKERERGKPIRYDEYRGIDLLNGY